MAVDRAIVVLPKERIMDKLKWLPRVVRGLGKAVIVVSAIIVILFALAVIAGSVRSRRGFREPLAAVEFSRPAVVAAR